MNRVGRAFRNACVFLGVGVVLAGCGTESFPVTPLQPLRSPVAIDIKWKRDFGSSEKSLLSPLQYLTAANQALMAPLLYRDTLYIANESGDLRALTPQTGKELWRIKTQELFSAGIGSGEDMLLLGNRRGEALAYNLKGELLWRSQLSSELMVAPQAEDGVVVSRTADGHIYGLNASDGKRRWMVVRPMPVLVLRGVGGVTLGRGAALIGMPGGKLLALNLSNGNVGWESSVSMPKGSTELERVNDVVGNPILGFRDVCSATYQGKTACLDAASGQVLWSRDISPVGAMAAEGNKMFLTDEKGNVIALNRSSGTVAWKEESLQGRYLAPPAVTQDYVVVGDIEGFVHFLSRTDGVEIGRSKTENVAITEPPLVLGENLVLVRNRNGKIFVLGPQ
ncbi:MAG: outer membrane protein assembly factor BamB [Burkholderiales bacterium]